MNTFLSSAVQDSGGAMRLQQAQANAAQADELAEQAAQDALWRIEQNNAMAKLRGYNTLAKAANDMA